MSGSNGQTFDQILLFHSLFFALYCLCVFLSFLLSTRTQQQTGGKSPKKKEKRKEKGAQKIVQYLFLVCRPPRPSSQSCAPPLSPCLLILAWCPLISSLAPEERESEFPPGLVTWCGPGGKLASLRVSSSFSSWKRERRQ